jgi:hypothetical protein
LLDHSVDASQTINVPHQQIARPIGERDREEEQSASILTRR